MPDASAEYDKNTYKYKLAQAATNIKTLENESQLGNRSITKDFLSRKMSMDNGRNIEYP